MSRGGHDTLGLDFGTSNSAMAFVGADAGPGSYDPASGTWQVGDLASGG